MHSLYSCIKDTKSCPYIINKNRKEKLFIFLRIQKNLTNKNTLRDCAGSFFKTVQITANVKKNAAFSVKHNKLSETSASG